MLTNADGTPFVYPYFISDSYDSTDAVNHFDWVKATDGKTYPENAKTQAYTKGLIALRRSTDAFTLKTKADVDSKVKLITIPNKNGVGQEDLIIAYQTQASGGDVYAAFVNADSKAREFVLSDDYKALLNAEILADADTAGVDAILNPKGVAFTENSITLNPLTATILRLRKANAETERTLYDQASGVSVILAPGEREEITQIEVHHKETNDSQTSSVLQGKDYDLYDIEPEDAYGYVVSTTQKDQVILPIDAGKAVAEVFYLPENAQPQLLAFREVSKLVAGQVVKFVIFDVDHFSQYGIVYQDQVAKTEVPANSNQVAKVTAPTQTQTGVWNQAASRVLSDLQKVAVTENSTVALPETGQKDSNTLTFVGLLSLASLAVLEVKRRQKSH